jgi:hypothetical protein
MWRKTKCPFGKCAEGFKKFFFKNWLPFVWKAFPGYRIENEPVITKIRE